MNFEIERDVLLAGLQFVSGAIERSRTMPVLGHVLLSISGGKLIIAASDLELELCSRVDLISGEDSETTVPARKLLDICKALPAGSIVKAKSNEKDQVVFSSGRGRYRLATIPASEFPSQAPLKDAVVISFKSEVLRKIISRVGFAAAQNDVRYYLNGILLAFSAGALRGVATDGHRLALFDEPCGITQEAADALKALKAEQIILPRKTSQSLRGLLDGNNTVELRVTRTSIQMVVDGRRLTSKLIEGKYPDYQRVIPSVTPNVLRADRNELLAALSRASILANERFRGVTLVLNGDNELGLESHNAEEEEANEVLEIEYRGAPLKIGFNLNYMTEALTSMTGDQCEIQLNAANDSGLILDLDNEGFVGVVMPLRI